jgi:hypothetical protein
MFPDWSGRTVACLASGPSLALEDCETVRAAGLTTVVTNTTYQKCPWAQMIFGFDMTWWTWHLREVIATSAQALRICNYERNGTIDANTHPRYRNFKNSGASAISLAIACGAERIVMLGYDCQKTGGKWHHHADHPEGRNCATMLKWPQQFAELAKWATVPILNASRETALTCFPRVSIDEAMNDLLVA